MTDALPPVNTLVRVDVVDNGYPVAMAVPSRVEELLADGLVVAAPRYAGDAVTAVPGTALTLRWVGPRGMYAAQAEIVAVEPGAVPHWRIRIVGEIQRVQRRRFARAPMDSVVAVVPVVDGLARVVGGWLLDLGEGGARARLEMSERLDPGAPVEVHLMLEDIPVVFTGSVLRVDEPEVPGELCEAVVVFAEPVAHADRIRRSVLRQQARARRGSPK